MLRISAQKLIIATLTSAVGISFLVSSACKKDLPDNALDNSAAVPDLTQAYATGSFNHSEILGRVLFYDKNLSLNNSTSCGSCHKQQHGFADNQRFSRGLMGKLSTRNTSSLIHSATFFFGPSNFFWDGRATSIEDAVLMPVLNQDEMHAIDLQYLPEKLAGLSYYPQLFTNAFGSPEVTVERIRAALAAFTNSLVAVSSRVNTMNSGSLTYDEKQGETIFFGKAKCYQCHVGQDFSGYDASLFFNIGLEYEYTDKGRYIITSEQKDKGVFKLPSLRNVAESAPYMHDGRFNTLREVIDHYDHGIVNNPQLSLTLRDIPQSVFQNMPPNVTDYNLYFSNYPVQSLNLTETEKRQLEAYLRAMSDPALLYGAKYSDPFRRQ